MDRTTVGIVFGGSSEEHNVSVTSAREVAAHLDRNRFDPRWVGITRDGDWLLCDGPDGDWTSGGSRAVLSPDRRAHGLLVLEHDRFETVRLDVVLPVLHGTHGEDGAMQGLLELSGIPYVGCDIESSVVCMDKSLAYVVARDAGVATPTFRTVDADAEVDPDRFDYPVYVKPARSGSSFGVTRVDRPADLAAAIDEAGRYDTKVLIEAAVVGSEVGCAVLGDGADLTIGALDQITLSHGLFRIHQEDTPEHGSENATVTVPADIPDEVAVIVRETATTIYRALGCCGLARVDMFLTDDGTVVLNEVNTLPGLTSYSRYPRMMAAAGLTLTDVLDRLISRALRSRGR